MTKRGLGRGLGALLSASPAEGETLREIPIEEIGPNPNQPRKSFNINGLQDLSASMRQSGVLQPVVVRRVGSGYQLIVGERLPVRKVVVASSQAGGYGELFGQLAEDLPPLGIRCPFFALDGAPLGMAGHGLFLLKF